MSKPVRAVLDFLAGAILAFAVLALPVSLVEIGVGHTNRWLILSFVLGCLLTVLAVIRFVGARAGSRPLREMLLLLVVTGMTTWGAGAFVGSIAVWAIVFSCPSSTARWVGPIGALVVYGTAGGWSLAQRRAIAIAVLPVAVVAAFIWLLLVFNVLLPAPGVCNKGFN